LALPEAGIAWPPKELAAVRAKYAEYSSWYSNDVGALGNIYSKGANSRGVLARIRNWFLGNKDDTAQTDNNKLHVSLAQEICRTSANLLYSEPSKAVVVSDADVTAV